MINHAMFQRNGRAGYVLKPLALRSSDKQLLARRTKHFLNITIISAQQLPRPKDSQGREIIDKSIVDPFVEVSIHIPDWTHSPFLPDKAADAYSPPTAGNIVEATSARTVTCRTGVVKNNGFNPVWEQQICLPFDLVGDMKDLVFVRFSVKQENKEDDEPLAVYCASLGSLNLGTFLSDENHHHDRSLTLSQDTATFPCTTGSSPSTYSRRSLSGSISRMPNRCRGTHPLCSLSLRIYRCSHALHLLSLSILPRFVSLYQVHILYSRIRRIHFPMHIHRHLNNPIAHPLVTLSAYFASYARPTISHPYIHQHT